LTHSPSHDIEQATEIVKTVLDLGINHFDVAESHSGKDGEPLGVDGTFKVMIRDACILWDG
jgi:predicted aldo/keto reductase-like oxidoreductase